MKAYQKKYYLGIDGGATKTILCLSDSSGDIVEVIKLGSTNYHTVGIDNTKATFKKAFEMMNYDHGVNLEQIKGICFGGAGIDSYEGEQIATSIFREIGYENELTVCNDAVIALVGANGGFKGGVVIGGTGSVALGVDQSGKAHKVGGWGHILDDQGSGYMIGRDALSKVMRYHDGRGRETKIWESVKDYFEITSPEQITDFVYSKSTKKQDIAKIAPLIIDLYSTDDVAHDIVEDAVSSLEQLIVTLSEKIQQSDFSLGLHGSIIIKNPVIKDRLTEKVHSTHPNIDLHLPFKKAYIGALDIALGKVKID